MTAVTINQATSLPRITIIMPSFEQGRYLTAALRSVIEQRYENLELLVYDGASQDESVEIIRRHASHIAWWQSRRDGGQVAAINAGLQRATGEVIGWLNSDDVLLPGALHAIGRAFMRADLQMVCGWNIAFDDAGRECWRTVYPQTSVELLRRRTLLPQETVYWRRGIGMRAGLLDDSFALAFDTDYWLRLMDAGAEPRVIHRFIGGFRQHDRQKTHASTARRGAEWLRLMQRVHGEREGAEIAANPPRWPKGWRRSRKWWECAVRWGWKGRPKLPTYAFKRTGGTF